MAGVKGKSVESLRVDTGKSRSDVAADLGVSERHLYRLEKGLTAQRPLAAARWRRRFSDYYGVKPEEILDFKEAAA